MATFAQKHKKNKNKSLYAVRDKKEDNSMHKNSCTYKVQDYLKDHYFYTREKNYGFLIAQSELHLLI